MEPEVNTYVDSKEKELVGNHKNAGIDWEKTGQPRNANLYDLQDKTVDKAVPYRIFHIEKNDQQVNYSRIHNVKV